MKALITTQSKITNPLLEMDENKIEVDKQEKDLQKKLIYDLMLFDICNDQTFLKKHLNEY